MTVSAPPRPQSWDSKSAGRADLWKHIFGNQTGLLAIWSGRRVPNQKELADPATSYYRWPTESSRASDHIERESSNGREAYFCAHLLTRRRRIKENAALVSACYVDADGAQPGPEHPQPTAIVKSSPGHFHFYYRLTRAIDPKVAEQLNRRLANQMQADMSGWDLTQVLRGPGCRNWKYKPAPRVEIVSIEDRAFDPNELDRILPKLPEEATPRAEVKLGRQQETAAPIGDRDQRALNKMYTSKRGPDLQHLANGGSVHRKPDGTPNYSSDDISYFNGLAFWLDKDPARMAAAAWRSGRARDKWNEVHTADGSTYLEMTIGTAISNCRQTFRELAGYDAGDEPPRIQLKAPATPVSPSITAGGAPAAPTGEPTSLKEALAEITRLRRALLDRDDKIELLTGIIEDQQQVIAATRAERDQVIELRARDRRVALAEQRLDRVSQFSAGQKAAIKTTAKIAPALAHTHQTDEPILTREMVGAGYGAKPDTAGDHLAVFDVEGSPIRRIQKPYGAKTLTHFKLETLDPVEIIERMAALGEKLEKRPTATKTPRCRTCPEGTGAILSLVCEGCGELLDERHVKARKAAPDANVEKNSTLCPSPPSAPVNVLVTYGGEKRHVAAAPEPDSEARATAMVGTDLTAVQLRPADREPVDLGRIRFTRQQTADPEPPPAVVPCTLCAEPVALGETLYCAAHRAEADRVVMPWERPAAVSGGEE